MPDPIAFNPNSADRMREPDNPYAYFDLIKGTYTNSTTLGSNGAVGFSASFSVNLSRLNLDLIIPDIDVYYHADTNLGSNIFQRTYRKLPFVTIDTNGVVSERAQHAVSFQYDNTKGQTPLTGTTFLSIEYYNKTSSASGQVFDYKIKSTRAQTINTTNLGA